MKQLQEYRKLIDKVDAKIIDLIAQRIKIAKKIAKFKQDHKIPRLDKKRFQAILNSRARLARLRKIDPELIKNIYRQIHEFILNIEL